MDRTHRLSAALLALCLALSLAACGGTEGPSKFEAAAYVDGLIKENYLGQFEETFLEQVGISEAAAKETYENGLEVEADRFLTRYDIDHPTDEFMEQVVELFREIYQHTRYEVVSAAQQEDGSYSVKVNVESIDIVQLVEGEWDKARDDFYEKYPYRDQQTMSTAEYTAMDREWAELILSLYQDKLSEIGNLTAQSLSVQLVQNEDGNYIIDSQDFARLDALIIDYPEVETEA